MGNSFVRAFAFDMNDEIRNLGQLAMGSAGAEAFPVSPTMNPQAPPQQAPVSPSFSSSAGYPGTYPAREPLPTPRGDDQWPKVQAGIFRGESHGDYDALFNFQNRKGGKFANTKLTNMTVDEAIAFSDPNGPYAQYVKGEVGRVATPMGAYQLVGRTLRGLKNELGLTGKERMTADLQDRLGKHLWKTAGTGQWEGYNPDSSMSARNYPYDRDSIEVDNSDLEEMEKALKIDPATARRQYWGAALKDLASGIGAVGRGQAPDMGRFMEAYYARQQEAKQRLTELARERRRRGEYEQSHQWNVEAEERAAERYSAAEDLAYERQIDTEGRAEDRQIGAEGRAEARQIGAEGRDEKRQIGAEGRAEARQIGVEGRAEERQISAEGRAEGYDIRKEDRATARRDADNKALAASVGALYGDDPELASAQKVIEINPEVGVALLERNYTERKAATEKAETEANNQALGDTYLKLGQDRGVDTSDIAAMAANGDMVGARDLYKERFGTTDAQLDAQVLQRGGPDAAALATRLRLEAGLGATPQEKAAVDLTAKGLDKEYENILANREKAGQLEAMSSLLNNTDVDTGAFQAAMLPFRQYLADFGIIDPSKTDQQAVINAIGNNLISYMRKPGEGVVSDADAKRFEAASPNLGKSPIANKVLTYVHLNTLQREEAAYQARMEYFANNGDIGDKKAENAYVASKIKEQFGEGDMIAEPANAQEAVRVPKGQPYVFKGKFYINGDEGPEG